MHSAVGRAGMAWGAALVLAVGLVTSALAADRLDDPVGDTPDRDHDIVAISTVTRSDAVIVEVNAARDLPGEPLMSVFFVTTALPTDCRSEGFFWAATYYATIGPTDGWYLFNASASTPGVPLDHVVNGSRFTFSVPLSALGNPQQLRILAMAGFVDRGLDWAPDKGAGCFAVSLVPEPPGAPASGGLNPLVIGLLAGSAFGTVATSIALVAYRRMVHHPA